MAFTHLAEPIPITEHNWPEGTIPLVTTRTITYMHEKYIRDCIDGILMQKTTFPVQVLIHDDASTDATADIMREYERKYPKLIQCFYQKENTYKKPNRRDLMKDYHDAVAGKYIALCEGDDYWTDPLKLQKQAEFLEANPDYGLVHTDHSLLNEKSGVVEHSRRIKEGLNPPDGNVFDDLLDYNFISTLTVFLRSKAVKDMDFSEAPFRPQDYSTWLHVSRTWKVKYLNDNTATYRVVVGSLTHQKDRRALLEQHLNFVKIRFFFAETYKTPPHVLQKVNKQLLYIKFALSAYDDGYELSFTELKQIRPKSKFQKVVYV